MNYKSLNVLNQKQDFMSDDAIQNVANMINGAGFNRGQRRRLEKAMAKTQKIYEHTQDRVNDKVYKEYQTLADEHMRRFFAIMGIILVKNKGYKPDSDELIDVFDLFNAYLVEYQSLTTDEVCQIAEEVTEFKIISE